jgi:hypothetical protein
MLKDISNYKTNSDWLPIIAATLLLEVYIVFRAMRFKSTGKLMYTWYLNFGLLAVLADVLIVLLGYVIIRYIYTIYIYPIYGFHPLIFIATLIIIQIIHDLIYYYLIVKPISRGSNTLIDYMKDYGKEYKSSAITGDSLIFIFTTFIAMILKGAPNHISIAVILLSTYLILYSITTRRM